ncbi:hypothetical protein HJB79_22750 [Rhizobium lentis]|uniref:hypothetical protein n=1 Tax=Rhizobium lentis TaxID=1138194 RepID=UPI001C83197B|nr:hypothetical protein [Rhizobium lentis]MBX5141557.1 hypothetical protein [Rhizobium lentis]
MDARLLKQVQARRNVSRQDITDGLVETIVQIGGDPLTVRKAKDELSAVLGKARNGVPQVIGNIKKADDMVVVITVKDLAELVTAARQQEAFGGGARRNRLQAVFRWPHHRRSGPQARAPAAQRQRLRREDAPLTHVLALDAGADGYYLRKPDVTAWIRPVREELNAKYQVSGHLRRSYHRSADEMATILIGTYVGLAATHVNAPSSDSIH